MSHDELNALCAEKVAGWKKSVCYKDERVWYWTHPTLPEGVRSKPQRPPNYMNDPEAVLALLEKEGMVEINRMHRQNIGWQWEVKVWKENGSFFPSEAEAPTFAEAGVRALLKAHGCEVGE